MAATWRRTRIRMTSQSTQTAVKVLSGLGIPPDLRFSGGPTRSDLEHILAEERAHFEMLSTCIEQLGGDPTAVTPSANLHATIAKGVVAVMTDPRTDLLQSLEATLVIELADNDCWEGLIELAEAAGEEELVDRFTEALAHEQEHLANVRAWIAYNYADWRQASVEKAAWRNNPTLTGYMYLSAPRREFLARAVYNPGGSGPPSTYRGFGKRISDQIFEEMPDVDRVQITMLQTHTTLPGETPDPEVKRVFPLTFTRSR